MVKVNIKGSKALSGQCGHISWERLVREYLDKCELTENEQVRHEIDELTINDYGITYHITDKVQPDTSSVPGGLRR